MTERRKQREDSEAITTILKYTMVTAGALAMLPVLYFGGGYVTNWLATPTGPSNAVPHYEIGIRREDAQKILAELLK